MPKSQPIHVDLSRTKRRVAKLKRYVESNLLRDGKFVCEHYKSCRDSRRDGHVFLEGTMGHVGKRFDLRRSGKPLRIVVVGQEAADRRVTLEKRYWQVLDQSGLGRRYKADSEHKSRNPHMRGVTSALRVIFGKGLGADYEGEWVYPENGKPFHVFDGFALLNRLMCFAGPDNSSQGRATRTMLNNCGDHLTETLRVLEPTILILQGSAATTWTKTALTSDRDFGPYLSEAHLGEHRLMVCNFSHPAARGDKRWGDRLDAPYLTDALEPTLREALRRS
jgi:hypothetical protein